MRRPRRAGKPGGDGGCGGKAAPGAEDAVAAAVKGAKGAPVVAVGGEAEAPVQGDPAAPAADRKADAPAAKGVAEKDDEGVRWLKHYSSMQSILVVGDGDFSFSLALATAFGSGEHIVATSLDSYDTLKKKYGNAEANITELKRLDCTVLHGVDAKLMKLYPSLKMRRFDRIVFNFPHAGFNGKEDNPLVINLHKQLVNGFFANAQHLLRPFGEIHLSHKTGYPYDTWDIEQLANESCLIMFAKDIFCKEEYPGYNQKRGDGAKCDQSFALGPCYTYKFCIGDVKKLKKARGNVGSVSSLGGSKFYPGILATDTRPFDLHPLAPAWPRPHFPPANRVDMPIMFDPYPFGGPPMERPGLPLNFYGPERAPYFHHQDMIQPLCRGPPLHVLPNQGSFHPPMDMIQPLCRGPPLHVLPSQGGGFHPPMPRLVHPEQPWHQERPPVVPPWRSNDYYSGEYQRSLQREYEIERQLMPGGASLGYSDFLENRYRESDQRWGRLEMLIQFYGGR
uniref:25S rRNA (uridine-N(3))-methyltransferase BMT5-like domain-containing protein n=1 Tax=Triticum urartu TaxID=4572 RepID=A0A8R7UJY7_TRIUA